ncbi:MAG: MerC family mercury resistance protein [Candidatus Rokubacteria bacterium]|nr:MerC family mercury resistance protein [Candidatus Rokubacteria bacterium]
MVRGLLARSSLPGIAGTCISATAALGCCAAGVLGPAAGVLTPLVAWLPSSIHYEVLYASVGVTLVGLVMNAIRHRRIRSLILGVVGAGVLLVALHEAWDVEVFRALVWSGTLALALAAITDVGAMMCRHVSRKRSVACAT